MVCTVHLRICLHIYTGFCHFHTFAAFNMLVKGFHNASACLNSGPLRAREHLNVCVSVQSEYDRALLPFEFDKNLVLCLDIVLCIVAVASQTETRQLTME